MCIRDRHANTEQPFGKAKFGIITNPPFKLAKGFVKAAHDYHCDYLAMILKASFWHAWKSRGGLWTRYRPSRIYALGWRPDFLDKGAPTMEVMWCIWEPNRITTGTEYAILPPIKSS